MLQAYIFLLCGMMEMFCPKIETGYSFIIDKKNDLVEKFNSDNFNQRGAILKVNYYNPRDIIFQHLPVKERVNKIEVNRMRNGNIIDTLKSVDIKEIIRIGG